MAEVKNAFIKSKMNKDLDDRLIPSGEYRDALNVQVSKSESSDVGALENVIGNSESVDFALLYAQTKTNQSAQSGFTFTLDNVTSLKAGMIVRGTGVTEGTKITSIAGSAITLDKTATLAANAVLKIVFDLTCIGYFADEFNNSIYSFFTDFTDNSGGNSTGYSVQGKNFIFKYNISNGDVTTLVLGNWLNFSKTKTIIGVNLLENLLFFTDNRNQPRKINVSLANPDTSNKFPTYYTSEDQISVAKYNPYECIKVFSTTDTTVTALAGAITKTTTLSAASSTKVLAVSDNTGITRGNGVTGPGVKTNTFVVNISGNDITTNKVQNLAANADVVFAGLQTTMQDVSSETLPNGGTALTNGNSGGTTTTTITVDDVTGIIVANATVSAVGFPVGVKIASITSATEIEVDPAVSFKNNTLLTFGTANPYYNSDFGGDPDFLEDKFIRFSYRFKFDDGENSIFAPFTQPCFIPKQDGYFIGDDEKQTFSSTIVGFMENKVTEIQLQIPLPANGDSLVGNNSPYKIKSIDILYKESDGLAVQVVDTIPIDSSFATATGANNVYQYNYESTKPFKTLPSKELIRVYDKIPVKAFSQEVISNRVVYGNFQDKHTPPASLNYQAAIFEKYEKGSQFSNKTVVEYPSSTLKQNRNYQVGIVLSDKFGRQSSTLLSSNTSGLTSLGFGASTVFSPYQTTADALPPVWRGDSIKLLFNEIISSTANSLTGTPGLYNGNATSNDYNPLGWFSYKVVVQQKEQDYYNVYNAGAMKGNPLDVTKDLNTSYISLINDNINKVPRDLSEVGPLQKQFRSSVRLIGRVQNTSYPTVLVGNAQFYPGRLIDTTSSIEDLNSLFDVSSVVDASSPPAAIPITSNTNPYFPFYKAESDPLIAQITTTSPFGLVNTPSAGTTPTYAAIENLTIFETEPDLSRLDFYFETSTSGLISELNTAIGLDIGGVFSINNFNFNQTEANLIGDTVVSAFNFKGIDDTVITATTATLDGVVDSLGDDRTGQWTLEAATNPANGNYNLKTAAFQYYGTSAPAGETYTFTFTVNDSTDPNNIVTTTGITATGALTNIAPTIDGGTQTFNVSPVTPQPGGGFVAIVDSNGDPIVLTGLNGTADTTRNTNNLEWEKVQGIGAAGLQISASGGLGQNGNISLSGTQIISVRLRDAGGSTVTALITVVFGPSNVPGHFTQPLTRVGSLGGSNGSSLTWYFTDSTASSGFNNLDASSHVMAVGYRQPVNSSSTPTLSDNPSSFQNGFVCSQNQSSGDSEFIKERQGNSIQDDAVFYVAISNKTLGSTLNSGYYTRTSASVEWRNTSFSAAWQPALDISGELAQFGSSLQEDLPNNPGTIVQKRIRYKQSTLTSGTGLNANSVGQLTETVLAGIPNQSPNYSYIVSLESNSTTNGYRIFAFNGAQDGYTKGEYRVTVGNMWDNSGTGYDANENDSVNCAEGSNNKTPTSAIQMGDANYGGPLGASGAYRYGVSTNNVNAACNGLTSTNGTYYAKEFIAKYVTQLYTDDTLTTKATFTAEVVRKFRIIATTANGLLGWSGGGGIAATTGFDEGYADGKYLAKFDVNGVRITSSLGCFV